ncbi:MAG: hypothetical protein LBD23_16985 [Oscillospiraceae bacterium]|nr:hypothetical protein [Oscillospiraceae bacterium]
MSDTEKILMIFSSKYEHDGKEISSILELDGLLVDIQVNPSRKTLERLLFENQYMCIIPCEPTIISGTSEYNVFRLLDALGFEYYGNNYITNLVLQDKTACLKLSGIGCPTKIITKFRYESDLENCITTIDSYPVFIEPFTSNVRSTTKKYIAHKKADVKNILNDIFSKDDFVDEALVQKQINGDELTVTVVGNSPYNINILTPIKSELENNIITEIISKAYELFNKLSLRDIAHFKFLISKELTEYYLIDISGTYLPSNVDFYNLKDDSVSLKELISSFTIVYLERTKRISNNLPRVRKLLNFLGKPKREKLLSLESKIQLKDDYTYEDVCNELKGRILMVDESNKYDFIKLIEKALKKVPKPVNTDSPFLGNQDLKYAFLDKYNELPLRPQNYESILKSSVEILNGQIRWHSPSVLYNVFPPVMFNTIAASAITNLYNPNAITHSNCAGFLDMEKQIVKQLSNLIGWNPDESAGVFTQGGKFCLTYAIKCGLNRCLNVTGNEEKPIVITSEINHYAIELSSFQLGIPKSNCIRIPINSEGTIDFKIFEKVLRETVECNIPIACIIFSGGNTTHCTVENI